ncbi:hypothetical protein [Croceicoccus mobilis]|uniref:hypothetical protein n=1 Tax=Croceicoccus mobilis TaxID=1703339 RepID=UPI0012E7E699|nr:hypothetical protein [Croceicoccus mobilis]
MNFTNSQMVTRLGSSQILIFGGAVAGLSGIFLVALFAMPSLPPFWCVYAAQSVYAAMVGLIAANSLAGAMNVDPQSAGSISSLVGAMHYGAGKSGHRWSAFYTTGRQDLSCGSSCFLAGLHGCLPRGPRQ